MRNLVLFCFLCCTKISFSQQNIYDSLAYKFYDLNAKEELSYQVVKSDLDRLIVSSKKNYYKHKVQEIDYLVESYRDLSMLKDLGDSLSFDSVFEEMVKYFDSLLEQQIIESQKNKSLYDFDKLNYSLWNKRKLHPSLHNSYQKAEASECGPYSFLTCYIENEHKFEKFSVIKYEVKDKIENWTLPCEGNTLAPFIVSKLTGNKDDVKLNELFVTCLFISDEIGNIFKIEKEFPLFKDYYVD